MKVTENQLHRLFRAARQAPDQEAVTMPVHLKTRVLAHWRAADPDALMATAVAALFRRAGVEKSGWPAQRQLPSLADDCADRTTGRHDHVIHAAGRAVRRDLLWDDRCGFRAI